MSTRCILAWVCLTMISAGLASPARGQDPNSDLARWANPPPPKATAAGPTVTLPMEATVAGMRLLRAEYMNATQVAAALKAGRDVAVLPVGNLRYTGDDMPLGSSILVQHATAVLLAERWNAIAFPPIPFGAAADAAGIPGTVSVPVSEQLAYVRAVVQSLLEGGFNRVVILGGPELADDLIGMANSLYRDTRYVVLPCWTSLWPTDANRIVLADPAMAAPLHVLAAAKVLGYPNLAETYTFSRVRTQPLAKEALDDLRRKGVSAPVWAASAPAQPLLGAATRPAPARFAEADVDKAVEAMRQEARRYDNLPKVLARYQEEVLAQDTDRPWSLDEYPRSVAKSYAETPPPARASGPAAPRVGLLDRQEPNVPLGPDLQPGFARVKLDLPAEASPAYLRKHRAEFMTGAEMRARMKDDPVVLLPCGAFEMHGPHGLLGTDGIEAYSQALVAAKVWDAVVLPPVYYTYAGATERWPGTVSVSPEHIIRYVKAVSNSLLDGGFHRVAIHWVHAPGGTAERAVLREIQQERGRVVFSARLRFAPGDKFQAALGYTPGEDIRALAGVKVLGHPGVFAVDEPFDVGQIKLPFHELTELRLLGGRPAWNMGLPTHHLAVRKCVKSGDEDKVIPLMREAAETTRGAPQAMTEYLEELEKARKATEGK